MTNRTINRKNLVESGLQGVYKKLLSHFSWTRCSTAVTKY